MSKAKVIKSEIFVTGLDTKYWIEKKKVRDAIMRLPDTNRRYILLKELGLE